MNIITLFLTVVIVFFSFYFGIIRNKKVFKMRNKINNYIFKYIKSKTDDFFLQEKKLINEKTFNLDLNYYLDKFEKRYKLFRKETNYKIISNKLLPYSFYEMIYTFKNYSDFVNKDLFKEMFNEEFYE